MAEATHFVGPIDRLLFMKTLPTLRGLDNQLLAALARTLREQSFNRGQRLVEPGQIVDQLYVVVTGRVEVQRGGETTSYCEPGDDVGFLEALAESEDLEAIAEVDTLVLSLSTDQFLGLFEEHFGLLQNTVSQLAVYHRALLEHTIDGTVRDPWRQRGRIEIPDRELDVVEKLVILRGGQIFQSMGLEALAMMAVSLVQERWAEGRTIWRKGDPSGHLLLVLRGEVEGRLGDRTFTAGPGYPLGNIEALAGRPRWYDAVALSEVVTLRGDHEALFDVLEDDFDVALEFLRAMARNALLAESNYSKQHGPLDSPGRLLQAEYEREQSRSPAVADQPQ